MIHYQVKLKLTKRQEALLIEWLPVLTSIWNWAVRKLELDAEGGIRHTPFVFQGMLAGVSRKVGVPAHVIQGILRLSHQSWSRCRNGLAKKPRLKGNRNKLNSIPFPDPMGKPENNKIRILGLGMVRYHKQDLPCGKIKCSRVVRKASGWYLCLFIDANPVPVPRVGEESVGIDPGYSMLITTSKGEKIEHPQEWYKNIKRLSQAQRGGDKNLAARLHERIRNQKKDRNHKLSRRLVSENIIIAFSKDNLRGLSRAGLGKSVAAAAHGQLRSMLAYKSRIGGTEYTEVSSKSSTRTCSNCGALTGPRGRTGLSVRQWVCLACGSSHDRDVNAAVNTLKAAVGMTVERLRLAA